MRVLRASLWVDPRVPPTVSIVRDDDVTDTLESIATGVVAKMDSALVLYDIFEMPDGSEIDASLEAGSRTHAVGDRERHQALLYHWVADVWRNGFHGRMPSPGAMMEGDKPSPLSVDELRTVFEQLAKHPLYNDFTLLYPAEDMTFVKLAHGKVSIES